MGSTSWHAVPVAALGVWAKSSVCLVAVGPPFRVYVMSFGPKLPKSRLKIGMQVHIITFQ